MPTSPCLATVPLPNGDTMYYGRQKMAIPDGGDCVRQCTFFIAPQITIQVADAPNPSKPVIIATLDDNGTVDGPRFTIFDIISVQVDDMTEIKVTAGLLPGLIPIPDDFYCNLIVFGTPLASLP